MEHIKTMKKKRWLWWVWFIVLFTLPYTPLISPYEWSTIVIGIPAQLLVWFAFTIVLLLSIWAFVRFSWKNQDGDPIDES